jgi:hypothetical protein
MGGFVQPWALLALPLVLLPFVLDRVARWRGEPVMFSSLYLLERARRDRPPRRISPRRWSALLRAAVIALLVLAAARPVAPGRGGAASHLPTRAVVAVDVSASVRQTANGKSAWEAVRATADTVLALAGHDDRLALAAIADRLIGWWEGPAPVLRRRLAALEPTARPSDWPAALEALEARIEDGTESYLLTDGSHGAQAPGEAGGLEGREARGYRAVWVWEAPNTGNRALTSVDWLTPEEVALEAHGWGPGVPEAATAGRRVGDRWMAESAIPVGTETTPVGERVSTVWSIADTATFAFREPDRHPFDDRRWVARGRAAAEYRVVRWLPPDEPPEPGSLFWEAALATSSRGARVERATSLAALVATSPDLALLPLRAYGADEAGLLADLARDGSRLLFAPVCADPACVPPRGWLPHPELAVPDLAWSLAPVERQAALAPRPETLASAVPEHLLAEVPVRGVLRVEGGPTPDVTWRLTTGAAAFWAREAVGLWLVPFGPPITRLGTTPVFPLIADAALAAWDSRWGAGGAESRIGEPLVAPAGATVAGPLNGSTPRTWSVAAGGAPPRPEEPGLYRVDIPAQAAGAPDGADAQSATTFVAVNADPSEGDLRQIAPAEWRAVWGVAPTPAESWRAALFPRRRGPELWPWALVLALAALAGEGALGRRAVHRPQEDSIR